MRGDPERKLADPERKSARLPPAVVSCQPPHNGRNTEMLKTLLRHRKVQPQAQPQHWPRIDILFLDEPEEERDEVKLNTLVSKFEPFVVLIFAK